MIHVGEILLLGKKYDILVHHGPTRNVIRFTDDYNPNTGKYSSGTVIESHPIIMYNTFRQDLEKKVLIPRQHLEDLKQLFDVVSAHQDCDLEIEMYELGDMMIIIAKDPLGEEYAMQFNMRTSVAKYISPKGKICKRCRLVSKLTK